MEAQIALIGTSILFEKKILWKAGITLANTKERFALKIENKNI